MSTPLPREILAYILGYITDTEDIKRASLALADGIVAASIDTVLPKKAKVFHRADRFACFVHVRRILNTVILTGPINVGTFLEAHPRLEEAAFLLDGSTDEQRVFVQTVLKARPHGSFRFLQRDGNGKFRYLVWEDGRCLISASFGRALGLAAREITSVGMAGVGTFLSGEMRFVHNIPSPWGPGAQRTSGIAFLTPKSTHALWLSLSYAEGDASLRDKLSLFSAGAVRSGAVCCLSRITGAFPLQGEVRALDAAEILLLRIPTIDKAKLDADLRLLQEANARV